MGKLTAKEIVKRMAAGAVLRVQFGCKRFYWLSDKHTLPVETKEAEQLINSGLLKIRDRGLFEGMCAQTYVLAGGAHE
jgi:hypothetical protein